MHPRQSPVTLVAAIFLCSICDGSSQIENAQWLAGTWENKTSRGIVYETWTQVNDTSMTAVGFIIRSGDTMVLETVSLVESGDGLYYIPIVTDQNDQRPIPFKSIEISEGVMIFENKDHDFPDRISYFRLSADSLTAIVSGSEGGVERELVFEMRKQD